MGDRRVLAQSEVTRVEVCHCGACYLTIGPITLCLQPRALGELGASIFKAIRSLRAEQGLREGGMPILGDDGRPAEEAACADGLAHICVPPKN
jgi:hypothetical protein